MSLACTGRRLAVVVAILLSSIACDQGTKSLAGRALEGRGVTYFGGVLRLSYVENPGAFLSLGAGLSEGARFWCFVVLAALGLAGLLGLVLFNARLRPMQTVAFSLVIGGGLSNVADRVFNGGAVIDFLNLGVGPIRTGIFNLADVAITCGGLLLLAISLLPKPGRQAS